MVITSEEVARCVVIFLLVMCVMGATESVNVSDANSKACNVESGFGHVLY